MSIVIDDSMSFHGDQPAQRNRRVARRFRGLAGMSPRNDTASAHHAAMRCCRGCLVEPGRIRAQLGEQASVPADRRTSFDVFPLWRESPKRQRWIHVSAVSLGCCPCCSSSLAVTATTGKRQARRPAARPPLAKAEAARSGEWAVPGPVVLAPRSAVPVAVLRLVRAAVGAAVLAGLVVRSVATTVGVGCARDKWATIWSP